MNKLPSLERIKYFICLPGLFYTYPRAAAHHFGYGREKQEGGQEIRERESSC